MKIRVTTDKYKYQGLYAGQEYEAARQIDQYVVVTMGKVWTLDEEECEWVSPVRVVKEECRSDEAEKVKTKEPIKSDGGSSSYYDIYLPTWLMQAMVDREVDGKVYIKTEELIEVAFESDFDFANAFKSLVRAFGTMSGGGKAGNDVDYEMNKVQYSANKIKERSKRKEQK